MCMVPFLLKPWIARLRGNPQYASTLVYSPLPQNEEGADDDVSDAEDALQQPSSDHKPHIPTGDLPMTGIHQALFLFPAVCDIAGTTLMNVGLILTPVSIYQMSRGALVLWVGILSVMFLRRRLRAYQWVSLVIVMLGVALVGLAGSMVKKVPESVGNDREDDGVAMILLKRLAVATAEMVAPEDPTKVFIGVLLITGAQIFTATQFVRSTEVWRRFRADSSCTGYRRKDSFDVQGGASRTLNSPRIPHPAHSNSILPAFSKPSDSKGSGDSPSSSSACRPCTTCSPPSRRTLIFHEDGINSQITRSCSGCRSPFVSLSPRSTCLGWA